MSPELLRRLLFSLALLDYPHLITLLICAHLRSPEYAVRQWRTENNAHRVPSGTYAHHRTGKKKGLLAIRLVQSWCVLPGLSSTSANHIADWMFWAWNLSISGEEIKGKLSIWVFDMDSAVTNFPPGTHVQMKSCGGESSKFIIGHETGHGATH